MDTKVANSFKVTKFELQSDKVIATVSDGMVETQIIVNRNDFEHYMTKGTDFYEYSLPCFSPDGDPDERTATAHIDTFWDEAESVICDELCGFLYRTEGSKMSVAADLELETSLTEIKTMTGLSSLEMHTIRNKMAMYGFNRAMATVERMSENRVNLQTAHA